ncbi:hypothetical protein T492DRAFT_869601, partial [Pavlovales sp. CCMP2436]
YGYEWLGAGGRLLLTPQAARAQLAAAHALRDAAVPALCGATGAGRGALALGLANAAGRFLVVHEAPVGGSGAELSRLVGLERANPGATVGLALMLAAVLDAVRARATSFRDPTAPVLPGLVDGSTPLPRNGGFGLLLALRAPSSAGGGGLQLPAAMRALLRPITVSTPDFGALATARLAAGGYRDAQVLGAAVSRFAALGALALAPGGWQADSPIFSRVRVPPPAPHADGLDAARTTAMSPAMLLRALDAAISARLALSASSPSTADERLLVTNALARAVLPRLPPADAVLVSALIKEGML